MPSRKHDRIAQIIARKHDVIYNKVQGPDIVTPRRVVEVEIDPSKFSEGIRQLQGFGRPRYLAVPNRHVSTAIERTKDIKVGVMNETGKVMKPAKRPRS